MPLITRFLDVYPRISTNVFNSQFWVTKFQLCFSSRMLFSSQAFLTQIVIQLSWTIFFRTFFSHSVWRLIIYLFIYLFIFHFKISMFFSSLLSYFCLIQFYMWFNFIIGLNFIFLCFKLIIMHYHTEKQRKIKIQSKGKIKP